MLQILSAVSTNPKAMDDFVSVMAGTLPAPAFFAPDSVARIMGDAHTAAPTSPTTLAMETHQPRRRPGHPSISEAATTT